MTDQLQTPAIVDLQDPLPESNWFWRRVFTFVSVIVIFGILIYTIIELARIAELDPRVGINALLDLCLRLLWLQFIFVLFYMVAPSAEQVVKMIQTAGLLRSGVQMASRAVQEGDRTEVAQTTGRPPQPRVPPVQGSSAHRPDDDCDDVAPRSRR